MNPTPTFFDDPVAQLFFSGRAHAYYATLGTLAICAGLALGSSRKWALAGIALSAGVFADMWAHQYAH